MLTLGLILEAGFKEGIESGLRLHLLAWFNIELLGGRKLLGILSWSNCLNFESAVLNMGTSILRILAWLHTHRPGCKFLFLE